MWQDELIKKINTYRGREITALQASACHEIFEVMDEYDSRRVVRMLSAVEIFPNNIVGWLEQHQREIQEQKQPKEYKKGFVDSGSPAEVSEYAKFLNELLLWHTLGLVKSNPDANPDIRDLDSYLAAGRPPTWSPILDDHMRKYEAALAENARQPGYLLSFLQTYNLTLKTEREKRTAKPEVAR